MPENMCVSLTVAEDKAVNPVQIVKYLYHNTKEIVLCIQGHRLSVFICNFSGFMTSTVI